MKEALITVQGMTCAACTSAVTEALERHPDVQRASVSLITNEAKVTFGGAVQPQALVDLIEDCGFDATLVSVAGEDSRCVSKFSVSGLTCGACTSSVTEALESTTGVTLASVSLITNSARVEHSASVLVATLLAVIEDCGFEAQLQASDEVGSTTESRFEVNGMTCGACSASITEALQRLDGVVTVNVSQMTNQAVVVHNSTLSPDTIVTTIEDCGFDARMTASADSCSSGPVIEQVYLQLHGITEHTDLSALQFNVEAALSGLEGVIDFCFIFKGQVQEVADASAAPDAGSENLIDELRLTVNTDLTSLRQLMDMLNGIDDLFQFVILNSVDHSLTAQLDLLSKVKEIHYWRSNFYWALALAVPINVLSYVEDTHFWSNLMIAKGLFVVTLIQFALATHIILHLSSAFFKKFIVFIRHRGKGANMDVLVSISLGMSYLFSIYSIILSVWTGQTDKPPKVLFDTVAMLTCFVSFGKWIENRAKGATSSALSRLMSLTPTTCDIVTDEERFNSVVLNSDEKLETTTELPTRTISIDLIQKNDIALVAPGGKIPADGVILSGSTEVDESIITGESRLVLKRVGDKVIGGSINGPFLIYMRVSGAGSLSQLQQIINIVKDSQVNKAPVQRFADYIAARFVAFVLILALSTFTFWLGCLWLFPEHLPQLFLDDENGRYFVCLRLAITVVVVACPCALGLAAPTVVMVGTGVGATHGALIKGGDVLEKASKVDIILFDKTGTLTCGEAQITTAMPILHDIGIPEDTWWTLVGSVEINSEHPTGHAIAKQAKLALHLSFEDDLFDTLISKFKVLAGMGVTATVTLDGVDYDVSVGNQEMIVKHHPSATASMEQVFEKHLLNSTSSVSHVVINDTYCGFLELCDTIKPCAKDAVSYLMNVQGYQVGMVTGDNQRVASRIGQELGIPEGNVFGNVSPIEKDRLVRDLRTRLGGPDNVSIAFVGDGINDSPALVQADVGMAISTGSDVAIDSAEVVILGQQGKTDDLFGVINALEISLASFRKIKWNFVCATVYNFFMLPFAMGCFLHFGLMLSPATAAAAMACSSISVVLNSLMLRNWLPPNIRETLLAYRYDEASVGDYFSLRTGTLQEFNSIKRGTLRSRVRTLGRFKNLTRFPSSWHRTQEYEMLAPA